MKRFIFPILWSGFVSLLLLPLFVFEQRTHAEANGEAQLKRKVSKDILQEGFRGQGRRFRPRDYSACQPARSFN